MSEHLIERLQQWPSCPAGADPLSSAYVGGLMKEAAGEIDRLREVAENIYSCWACGEPTDKDMRELGRALGFTPDPD